MYSIKASVGTPAQNSTLMVSLNTAENWIFRTGLEYFFLYQNGSFDDFYNSSASTSAKNISESDSINRTACGLILQGDLVKDKICLDNATEVTDPEAQVNGVNLCITSSFTGVSRIYDNLWMPVFNFSNIGGIFALGISKFNTNEIWSSNGIVEPQFAVNLYPAKYDWDWIPGISDFSYKNNSYIYLGGVDPYVYDQELSNENVATILVSENATAWVFQTQSFVFGDDNDALRQFNLAGTYTTLFEIGFNGIGIPSPKWVYWSYLMNQTIYQGSQGKYWLEKV